MKMIQERGPLSTKQAIGLSAFMVPPEKARRRYLAVVGRGKRLATTDKIDEQIAIGVSEIVAQTMSELHRSGVIEKAGNVPSESRIRKEGQAGPPIYRYVPKPENPNEIH